MIPDEILGRAPVAGPWSCSLCSFRRDYATDQGALQGAAKHLMDAHEVRLKIAERHHGGMVHAKGAPAAPAREAPEDERQPRRGRVLGAGSALPLLIALAMMGVTIAPPREVEPKDPEPKG